MLGFANVFDSVNPRYNFVWGSVESNEMVGYRTLVAMAWLGYVSGVLLFS